MLSKRTKLKLINWWPPLWGAGIRVESISEGFHTIRVALKMRWYNKNIVGVHYGGSLYSMCDPWYMLQMMELLGRDFVVWDKAASIRFKKPGMGTLRAEFHIGPEQVKEIKATMQVKEKHDFVFNVSVHNANGEVVAEVEKVVYVRWKEQVKKREGW
jgi:hypothetical protein